MQQLSFGTVTGVRFNFMTVLLVATSPLALFPRGSVLWSLRNSHVVLSRADDCRPARQRALYSPPGGSRCSMRI